MMLIEECGWDGQSSYYSYGSFGEAFFGLLRAGPKEIFRGAVASSLRDAPYAGIFVVFYEHIKNTLCTSISLLCSRLSLTVTFYSPLPIPCSSSLDCSPRDSRGASSRHPLTRRWAGKVVLQRRRRRC